MPTVPWRHRYFVTEVGLVWSNDPESNASGIFATGMASHAREVQGDDSDKNG